MPTGRVPQYLWVILAITLLAACGGGEPDSPTLSAHGERRASRALFSPTGPIPPDADTQGMWSAVTPWPLIAVHAVLMPDGRVMSYGTDGVGTQTGYFIYDVWDPQGGLDGGHLTLPNSTSTDIFCSSQVVLPSGSAVFIAGGDNWTGSGTTNTGNNNSNLFTLEDSTLARAANMNRPRWYSSSTMLLNGEVYIQGGSGGTDRPEVRQADGTFRLLSEADTGNLDFMYPRNFVAPDGRVFGYDSNGWMYYVDPAGTGSLAAAGQFNAVWAGSDSSAAMFRPGRILQFGGNSNNAVVIDIRGGAPVVSVSQPMSTQRRLVTATLLADGKVLATGGSRVWNELIDVNTRAEIWNPDTGAWTLGAAAVQARLYHSTALLLPDATVLVLGGGAPGPQVNTNVELYFPPYLFGPGGTLAERPSIDAAPTAVNIGSTFHLDVSGPSPARIVMVKAGSVTHSWNMDQRFVELVYQADGSGVAVQAPTRAADAPPGFYMLFALDANGVPSMARMVRVNVAEVANPSITPSLAAVPDQTSMLGQTADLQLVASDPNGDALGYGASGLPPGMSIDPFTGAIGGQALAIGTFHVVVAVSDGINSATTTFLWTVDEENPFVLESPPAVAAQTGEAASFTASAQGFNTLYKWDFGDGSPETAYSSSPDVTHVYSQPGLYVVTVTAIDVRNVEQRQTLLQAVYLPPTAQRPSASSNVIVTPGASGANPRIWVVNQDNDSVTAFDAVTGSRLAEISVGNAPRALAVAPNGRIWVTNLRSGTLSVLDPVKLKVARTITLARGSQPFGIAISSAGQAFVALTASGQLQKLDAATYAKTGVLALGPNLRHVSLDASGGSVYLPRFITPPVAGESTAAPQTDLAVAELLVVDAASMTLARTIGLAHSDKPDAENQGSGIPNYLGAAVISPDGGGAWLPSKQDNIKRGALRNGQALNFQNTVRAISSRIDLATGLEDLSARIDHDNASVASAAVFDRNGVYLFVALETSREVAVIDAYGRHELFRFEVGLAPQGLALTPDGSALVVNNFMERTLGVFDLKPLLQQGQFNVPQLATLGAVSSEHLPPDVLRGKQLFYDARDTRLARDRYLSCAACHNDGGHDGRVWDLTGFGEGLRNTIALRGRAGMAHGNLHWSNNFDEVQDFEGQIRTLAGGTGLMADADFHDGTRSEPMGDAKAGISPDLDALAAYLGSLGDFDASPRRPNATTLSTPAGQGRELFANLNCASCHGGVAFTRSAGVGTLADVGTLKPGSGQRLGGPLTGIDIPSLRDVWATAPYLHDGSAATLQDAVRAHAGVSLVDAQLASLAAYLSEIGSDEPSAPEPRVLGTGLRGSYFDNPTLTGSPVLVRDEAVDFGWGSGSPQVDVVPKDRFSARWLGSLYIPYSGTYRVRTVSDEGVRVWIDDQLVIDRWDPHTSSTDTSANLSLQVGTPVRVRVEYYDLTGKAVMRLRWKPPGSTAWVAVPIEYLYPQ